MAVDITVESTSDSDNVHWKLSDSSSINLDSISIKTTNTALNWIISHMSGQIKKLITSGLAKAIDTEINALNSMIAQEAPYTFDVAMFGLKSPLNLTMTTAPSIVKDSSMIKLNFDGLFDKPKAMNAMNFDLKDHEQFPDIQHSHRDQFWIHQNTINSFVQLNFDKLMPLNLNTTNISDEILEVLPDIEKKCGKNVTVKGMKLDLLGDINEAPIAMTRKDGIRVGNVSTTSVALEMLFDKCKMNGTEMNGLPLSFSMTMEVMLNFTMQDTVFYLFGKRAWIKNTKIVENKMNITTDENLDMIFTSIIDSQIEEFND